MQQISLFHVLPAIQLILQRCDESVAQIFTHAHPKTFTQLKFFMKLSLLANNQAISSLRVFQPISQEPNFSGIRGLYRTIANYISFHYRSNLKKIMTKLFKIKLYFCVETLNFTGHFAKTKIAALTITLTM